MNQYLTISEYDLLYRGVGLTFEDGHGITESDWDWLISDELQLTGEGPRLIKAIIKQRRRALQVLNYVGVFTLPSGTTVEILPKGVSGEAHETARRWLFKMLLAVNDLPSKTFRESKLQVSKGRLFEVLIGRFLADAQHVFTRGLRSSYVRIDAEEPYLRGKLKFIDHIRQAPDKRTKFPLECDDYILDRPENRLLVWSLNEVYHYSRDSNNRSHARKLLTLLASVPISTNPENDFKCWDSGRLMQHYAPLRPWINLIIKNLNPWTQRGIVNGPSMLFPMERLFEEYVHKVLSTKMNKGFTLAFQPKAGWLTEHMDEDLFRLKPDFLVEKDNVRTGILDTKWKLINQTDRAHKYGISESDMYQLFAYAHKCLPNNSHLVLIYPKTNEFDKPLPHFSFGSYMLWAVPFDLENDILIDGEWSNNCSYFLPA